MASRFWVGGTGTWDNSTTTHWSATTGGAGGASVPGSGDTVTFDASSGGGVVTPNYNLSISSLSLGAYTGTLDFSANNNSPTIGSISSTGTGSKTLNMGSGTWTITGTGTPWNLNTTGLTLNAGTSTVLLTGSAVTFTGGSGNNYYNITFSGGGASAYSTTGSCNNLTYTGIGASDSLSMNAGKTILGTFTITGSSAVNRTSVISTVVGTVRVIGFATAAFTNASFVDISLNFTGGVGTWTLTENLTVTSTGNATLTITSGIFNANNFNVTVTNFNSSNSNVRTVSMGNGTWTITGTGTVFTLSISTNLVFNCGASTIKMIDSSNTVTVFVGGGNTFNNIWFSRGVSTASNTISGNITNTFNSFRDDGSAAHSLIFSTNSTTIVSAWSVSGSSGNAITLDSTSSSGIFNLVKSGADVISSDWLNIQHSVATPALTWYAGVNSVNNQAIATAGSGWIFTAPPVLQLSNVSSISNITQIGG